jgi:hypothetical protein
MNFCAAEMPISDPITISASFLDELATNLLEIAKDLAEKQDAHEETILLIQLFNRITRTSRANRA